MGDAKKTAVVGATIILQSLPYAVSCLQRLHTVSKSCTRSNMTTPFQTNFIEKFRKKVKGAGGLDPPPLKITKI